MVKPLSIAGLAVAGLLAAAPFSAAQAQGKSLTMCWAAWDPANALVELDKDFTKQTGIEMKHEFVPWTSYADHFINLLNSRSAECDLIIGDSQWIGGAAENKWYVKLNDFFDKNNISMDGFLPATVVGYAEWPKDTPNYWGLPAMADAVGWTYRKDWFAKPDLRAEFKAKYNRELEPPKTWDELLDIAKFFTGKEIDGKKVYGSYIFTERGSEGITMGVTNAMYKLRLRIYGPEAALPHGGLRQFPRRGQGHGRLQGALRLLPAERSDQRLYARRPRRLQVGRSRDANELVRVLPGTRQGSTGRRRQDRILQKPRRPLWSVHATGRSGPFGRGRVKGCR
jgi:multiple sugar transport system substrate-binding protein